MVKNKKVGVISLGCDKNRVDTEKMLALLSKRHQLVSDIEQAEIIIINTCAFLESSRKEAVSEILSSAELKQTGKAQKIIVTGCLPQNYVTKSYCQNVLNCSTGKVQQNWCDGHGAIGGDVFKNREGLLPKKDGRTWTECDINTWGRTQRGAERIVFSNDGLVYYTANHYASFELLYGEP